MPKIKPRIQAKYKPGKGDSGNTNLFSNQKDIKKTSCLTQVNISGERLQACISECLAKHRGSPFFSDLQNKTTYDIMLRVENAIHDLLAFYYTKGSNPRTYLNESLEQDIESLVDQWRKSYGESLEFQRFSTHENLAMINIIKVEARALEVAFNDSIPYIFPLWFRAIDSLGIANHIDSDTVRNIQNRAKEVKRYQAFLNRLSYFFWLAAQRERVALGLEPLYWL